MSSLYRVDDDFEVLHFRPYDRTPKNCFNDSRIKGLYKTALIAALHRQLRSAAEDDAAEDDAAKKSLLRRVAAPHDVLIEKFTVQPSKVKLLLSLSFSYT